jgi:hypothetical protein
MSYIIERPAGMPDWVEIGIKVMVRDDEHYEWKGPYELIGYDYLSEDPFIVRNVMRWLYAKPFTPWTPKEGEWCAFWDEDFDYHTVRKYQGMDEHEGYDTSLHCADEPAVWKYCARITNEDGTLIDIRCTVDELKAKTDWLGPEEA